MNQKLKKLIEQKYNIGKIKNITKSSRGYLSHNYIIKTDGQKYFLKKKQTLNNNDEKMNFICQATIFFAHQGIPIIEPIKTKDEKYFFKFEKNFHLLFPYVTGIKRERGKLSGKQIESMGAMMAKLHLAGRNGYPILERRITKSWSKNRFYQTYNEVIEVIKGKKKLDQIDKLFLEEMELKKDFVDKNTLSLEDFKLKSNHLVHGDYHDSNVLFDGKSNVKYIFDLKSVITPRVLELIRTIDMIFFKPKISERSFACAKLFLKSYQAIYPISKEELTNGIRARITKSYYTLWKEEEYYLNGNKSVSRIIASTIIGIKYYNDNTDIFIEKLTADF